VNPQHHADRIALWIRAVCLLALLAVAARVIQLQAYPGADLRAAINARTSGSDIDPVRGDLLDRRGRVLSTSRVGWRVIVDPVAAGEHTDRVIVSLSTQLGASGDDIGGKVMRAAMANSRRIAEHAQSTTEEPASSTPQSADASAGVRAWLSDIGLVRPRPADAATPGLIRYVPVSGLISQDEAQAVKGLKLRGVFVERRSVRDIVGGESVASLLGKVGYRDFSTERIGLMGAEKLFQEKLEGEPGSLRYKRDALGRPLWVERGDWTDATPGRDIRMSVDAEIQRIVTDELRQGMDEADAAGGRAIVLDPHSGEILAMVDLFREVPGLVDIPWHDPTSGQPRQPMPTGVRFRVLREDPMREVEPALARNRCVEDIYEPGSTFKPFVWAAGYQLGRLKQDEIIRSETRSIRTWYGRLIQDVTFRKEMTWDDVLRVSSNIGMYNITERLTHDELREFVVRLGFGQRTNIGLPGETAGKVTSRRNWTKYTQTSVGMGYEVGSTMLQLVRGFSVFARRGDDAGTLPGVRLTAAGPEDDHRPGVIGEEIFVERVFSPEAAIAVREPLKTVVQNMDNVRLRKHPGDVPVRYTMFGKSGTAYIACTPPPGMQRPFGAGGYIKTQYTSSFLVAAPAEDPEIVILVVIDDPGPALVPKLQHYGSHVAGPVVRRIAERVLPYLGVPAPSENAAPPTDTAPR
jgi:cell division protein FtsI (penicillin-binding protein 3)